MSSPRPSGAPEGEAADTDRKRRLAKELDGALPDGTRDEGSQGWGEREDGGAGDDDRLRREVPPHHG